jgi:hypothetical protein
MLTERKLDEKEDMWQLWNKIREDGDQSASLLGKDQSATSKGSVGRGGEKGKYSYSFSGQSIADSVKAVTSNGGGSFYNPRNITGKNATFELNNGRFDTPERASGGSNSRAPSTYTYNNNTYNINQSKTPEGVKSSPGPRQVLFCMRTAIPHIAFVN